MILDNTFLNF